MTTYMNELRNKIDATPATWRVLDKIIGHFNSGRFIGSDPAWGIHEDELVWEFEEKPEDIHDALSFWHIKGVLSISSAHDYVTIRLKERDI